MPRPQDAARAEPQAQPGGGGTGEAGLWRGSCGSLLNREKSRLGLKPTSGELLELKLADLRRELAPLGNGGLRDAKGSRQLDLSSVVLDRLICRHEP